MNKVIFICKGNIFRSQIAKGLYNKSAKPGWVAESYGTVVQAEGLQGHPIKEYPGMVNTIEMLQKEEGVDISHEHAEQVTPEHLRGASKIVVMAEKEYIPEWLKSYEYEYWDVPQPNPPVVDISVQEVINLIKTKLAFLK